MQTLQQPLQGGNQLETQPACLESSECVQGGEGSLTVPLVIAAAMVALPIVLSQLPRVQRAHGDGRTDGTSVTQRSQ